jgi:hypothetical protein
LPNKRNEHRLKFKSSRHHPCWGEREMWHISFLCISMDTMNVSLVVVERRTVALYPKMILSYIQEKFLLLFISFIHSQNSRCSVMLFSFPLLLYLFIWKFIAKLELITMEKWKCATERFSENFCDILWVSCLEHSGEHRLNLTFLESFSSKWMYRILLNCFSF